MNRNKKSAKQYHQSVITALEKKVNDMKDSAYSGLYSEIAFIIGIAVIMIDTFFPPEETKVNCVWKIILIAVSIVCMLYFAKKVKTVNEVEEEKKFWPNFFIQWATSLGYISLCLLYFFFISKMQRYIDGIVDCYWHSPYSDFCLHSIRGKLDFSYFSICGTWYAK